MNWGLKSLVVLFMVFSGLFLNAAADGGGFESQAHAVVEQVRNYYASHHRDLERFPHDELKLQVRGFLESIGVSELRSDELRAVRDDLAEKFLGVCINTEAPAVLEVLGCSYPVRHQLTVNYYKIVINFIQSILQSRDEAGLPRPGGRVVGDARHPGILKAIYVNERAAWQKLDATTLQSCGYYALYHALCAVAERESINDSAVEYGNDVKFKALKSFWCNLMKANMAKSDSDPSWDFSWNESADEHFQHSLPEWGRSLIIEKLCSGDGGVTVALAKAFEQHVAYISFAGTVASNLFYGKRHRGVWYGYYSRGSSLEDLADRYSMIMPDERPYGFGEKTAYKNIEKFRQGDLSYIVVLTEPLIGLSACRDSRKKAAFHAVCIVFDLDFHSEARDVYAEFIDSSITSVKDGYGPLGHETIEKIYYQLFSNLELASKIEEYREYKRREAVERAAAVGVE